MSIAETVETVDPPGLREHRWRWRDLLIGLAPVIIARVVGRLYAGAFHHSFPAWSWIPLALIQHAWLAGWPLLVARPRLRFTRPRRILVEAGYALLAVPVLMAAVYGVAVIAWLITRTQEEDNFFEPIAGAGDRYHSVALVLLAVVVAPVAEELFFRGMLFNALRQRMPIGLAAILSAAIFGLLHPFGLAQRLSIVVGGLFLALLYGWRKTLVAPILLHGLVNALGMASLFYTISVAANGPVLGVYGEAHEKGCIVKEVIPGSAAEEAGLRPGDIITHAGEYAVRNRVDLTRIVGWKRAGDRLPVWYDRGDEPHYVEAVLKARPMPPIAPTPPEPK
ncbi:CPBP family glutamic-type intramembrane protease [Tundrisphaera sp. TA3]|uniref:CPBP family intramembrane glutamic endopeptidase n=1 Tax=Tundrisphaera sp. TA3 TaxID=3435775 RepID=UPI003EB8640C